MEEVVPRFLERNKMLVLPYVDNEEPFEAYLENIRFF